MVEVPLSWKLSVSGAEDVKSKLAEVKSQFDRGAISSEGYAKGLREVNRDARTLTRQSDIQKNVWLASHPALNQLSRGMSAFNSVAHSALSISNALNLMFLRQQGDTTQLAVLQHDLAAAQRDYNKAVKDGDLVGQADAMERIRIATAGIKELTDGQFFRGLSDFITMIGSISLAAGGIATAIKTIGPALAGLGTALGAGSLAEAFGILAAAAAPIAALAAGIAAAALGLTFFLAGLNIEPFKSWAESLSGIFGPVSKMFIGFFTIDAPKAINEFFTILSSNMRAVIDFMKNVFITAWKIIWENDLVNAVKTALDNSWSYLTGWAQALVDFVLNIFKTGGRSSSSSNNFGGGREGGQVTGSLHASGFEGYVNKPTMMMVGEAGGEYVSITPHNQSNGNGTTVIFQNNGTIVSEREVFNKFDSWFKGELKKRGWTNLL